MEYIQKKCLECDSIITESAKKAKKYQKRFCSRSCGASHSNKIRDFKPEWRIKISDALKQRFKSSGAWGNIRSKVIYKCTVCNTNITYRRKTCSKAVSYTHLTLPTKRIV